MAGSRTSSRMRRGAGVLGAVALAGTSIAAAAPGAVASGTSGARAGAPIVRVYIGPGRIVHMTHRLRPGRHVFVVHSAKASGLELVSPRPGYTRAQAAHDVNAGLGQNNTRALKRFERHVALLGGAYSGPRRAGRFTLVLPRGRWWAVDTDATPLSSRQIHGGRTQGTRIAGAPHGTVITAVGSTRWAKSPASIPHRGVLKFVNRATDNHFVEIDRLKPGKTARDFRRWVNKAKSGQNPGPPPIQAPTFDSLVVSPGHAMSTPYNLPRGRYLLVCWWPDADMGGQPHAFMGMFRGIRLR